MSRPRPPVLAALVLVACEAAPPPAVPSPSPAPPAASAACPEAEPLGPYVPKPAYTGPRPALPSPDGYVPRPARAGDAYTVWGAAHHLRSRFHYEEVTGKRIAVVGYVVTTNYDTAPACAVHAIGHADPPGCRAPVPSFFIADEKGSADTSIEVMGWASNFAQLFSLMKAIEHSGGQAVVRRDEFWGNELPVPVPAVGAKVRVKGTYDRTFTKAAGGIASNPTMGILTAEAIEVLEPAPKPAVLPGMKRGK